jgi:hypothetical protein
VGAERKREEKSFTAEDGTRATEGTEKKEAAQSEFSLTLAGTKAPVSSVTVVKSRYCVPWPRFVINHPTTRPLTRSKSEAGSGTALVDVPTVTDAGAVR